VRDSRVFSQANQAQSARRFGERGIAGGRKKGGGAFTTFLDRPRRAAPRRASALARKREREREIPFCRRKSKSRGTAGRKRTRRRFHSPCGEDNGLELGRVSRRRVKIGLRLAGSHYNNYGRAAGVSFMPRFRSLCHRAKPRLTYLYPRKRFSYPFSVAVAVALCLCRLNICIMLPFRHLLVPKLCLNVGEKKTGLLAIGRPTSDRGASPMTPRRAKHPPLSDLPSPSFPRDTS